MTKLFKILVIIFVVSGISIIALFEIVAVDRYIDSKIEEIQLKRNHQQDYIMLPSAHIELNEESSVEIPKCKVKTTLVATPEEFTRYINSISNDGINQIVIKGEAMGDDTKNVRWYVWTTTK